MDVLQDIAIFTMDQIGERFGKAQAMSRISNTMLQNANITKNDGVKEYQNLFQGQIGFNMEWDYKQNENASVNVGAYCRAWENHLIALKAQNKISGDYCVVNLDDTNLFGDKKGEFFKLSTTEASNLFSYPLFGGIVGGADIAIVLKSYFDEYLTKQLQSNEEYVDRVLFVARNALIVVDVKPPKNQNDGFECCHNQGLAQVMVHCNQLINYPNDNDNDNDDVSMDKSKSDKKDENDEYEEKAYRAPIIIHTDLQTHRASNVYYYNLRNEVYTVRQIHLSRLGSIICDILNGNTIECVQESGLPLSSLNRQEIDDSMSTIPTKINKSWGEVKTQKVS